MKTRYRLFKLHQQMRKAIETMCLDISNLLRGDSGVGLGENLSFGTLVVVRATVLLRVTVVAAEGVSAMAFDCSKTKLLFAARESALIALLTEESAIFSNGRGGSARRDTR